VQLAASSDEAGVLGGSSELGSTLSLVVQYRNTTDQPQQGLSLRVPQPAGTQILAAARGEEQPDTPGERVWSLGELAAGGFRSFELTLQFLSVEDPTVPLAVEIGGDGFDEPVPSEPVIITVVP
jgi:hypothetical protein